MKNVLLITFCMCSPLFAQDTLTTALRSELVPIQPLLAEEQQGGKYSIVGTVIDQSTREPIANAKVAVLGTKSIATTSADGQYTVSTNSEGIFQLKAEADGYEPQILNNVYFKEGKNGGGFFALQKVSQGPPLDFVPVDVQPQLLSSNNPAPVYPEEARKQKIEGTVWVKMWIDKKGNARRVEILKSDAEIFNQASIDAAMKWKFSPAMLKGEPVDVWVSIPFKFKLSKDIVKSEELDKQPVPQKMINPKYPESARKLHLVGEFFLNVTIDEQGNVINAIVQRLNVTDNRGIKIEKLSENERKNISDKTYTSIEEMKLEAERAVQQWKFSPGMKGGKAVKTTVILPVKYALEEKKEGKKK